MPLQGGIVVCYGWGGGRRPTLEEWTWRHCCAIAGCQSLFHIFLLYSGPPISPRHPRKQQCCFKLLADVTLFSTLIKQKLVFAIWGLCWYNSYIFNDFQRKCALQESCRIPWVHFPCVFSSNPRLALRSDCEFRWGQLLPDS